MAPGTVFLPLLLAACAEAAQDGYFWPQRGHDTKSTGASPHVGPHDLAAGPAWTWPNEGDELVRHGPLIDDKKNVYLVTSYGWVRKFSPEGSLLWAWHNKPEEGKVVASGALYNGSIYIASILTAGLGTLAPPNLFALSLETGEVRLRRALSPAMGLPFPDSHTLVIHDGVVFLPSKDTTPPAPFAGNNKVVAIRAADGEVLWQRRLDDGGAFTLVWNFMPSFPGDGTLLLSTPSARAFRLNASSGEIIWKAKFEEPAGWMGTGGGALSPDGRRFYALGTYRAENNFPAHGTPLGTVPPCVRPWKCVFGDGLLVAYSVEDGEILWARRFLPGVNGQQYPAVGGISGPGSRTAVFVGLGLNTNMPELAHGALWLPGILRRALSRWQLYSEPLRRFLGVPILENHVMALDAETGADIWHWREEPWDHWACAGDEERHEARLNRAVANPYDSRYEYMCAPDSWGIPTIGGDGTVYASSGHTGNLYAIRDANGDGRIQKGEVSTFKTHNGFLNGPALAPGILAASPCWGPMYVFKS